MTEIICSPMRFFCHEFVSEYKMEKKQLNILKLNKEIALILDYSISL